MDVYDFGNGKGHIHLPHDMLEGRNETDIYSHLAKRAGASYTARLPIYPAHHVSSGRYGYRLSSLVGQLC